MSLRRGFTHGERADNTPRHPLLICLRKRVYLSHQYKVMLLDPHLYKEESETLNEPMLCGSFV